MVPFVIVTPPTTTRRGLSLHSEVAASVDARRQCRDECAEPLFNTS
jgi:hypothetical protein